MFYIFDSKEDNMLKVAVLLCSFSLLVISGCNKEYKGDGDTNNHAVRHDGRKRCFRVYLPANYNKNETYPMVIALHGRFGTGKRAPKMMYLNTVADEKNVILVYPEGIKRSWNDGRGDGPAAEQNVDDVGFVTKMIDYMIAEFPINPNKVYATGMSNGGFMSMRLACELNHKIAAFASVTGSLADNYPCQPNNDVPIMLIAGTEDPLVPYQGGIMNSSSTPIYGFEDLLEYWATNNSCSTLDVTLLPEVKADGTRAERWEYSGCDKKCILYKIIGGGHTWPSGGPYLNENTVGKLSEEIDASKEMIDFFLEYSL